MAFEVERGLPTLYFNMETWSICICTRYCTGIEGAFPHLYMHINRSQFLESIHLACSKIPLVKNLVA
jgi:hypothetical protein